MARLLNKTESRWIRAQMGANRAARRIEGATETALPQQRFALQIRTDPEDPRYEIIELQDLLPSLSLVKGAHWYGWSDQSNWNWSSVSITHNPLDNTPVERIQAGSDFWAMLIWVWDSDPDYAKENGDFSELLGYPYLVVFEEALNWFNTDPNGGLKWTQYDIEKTKELIQHALSAQLQHGDCYVDWRFPPILLGYRTNGIFRHSSPGLICWDVPPDEISTELRTTGGYMGGLLGDRYDIWGIQLKGWDAPEDNAISYGDIPTDTYIPLNVSDEDGRHNEMRYLSFSDLLPKVDDLSIEYNDDDSSDAAYLQIKDWDEPEQHILANVGEGSYVPVDVGGGAVSYYDLKDLLDKIDDEAEARADEDSSLSARIDALEQGTSGPYWKSGDGVTTCYGSDIGNSSGHVVVRLDGKALVGDWGVYSTAGSGAQGGNFTVENDLSVGQDLGVTRDANIVGIATVGTTLKVDGDATIQGPTTLVQNTLEQGDLTVDGKTYADGGIETSDIQANKIELVAANSNPGHVLAETAQIDVSATGTRIKFGNSAYKFQTLTVNTTTGTQNILALVPV